MPTKIRVRREAFEQYERQLAKEKAAPVVEEKPPKELPPPVPAKKPNEVKVVEQKAKAKKAAAPAKHSILSTKAPLYSEETIKNNPGAPAEPNMCDPGQIAEVRAALSHLQHSMLGKCSNEIVATDRMIVEISSNAEKSFWGGTNAMCQSSKWVREANSAVKQVETCVNKTIKTAERLRNEDFDKMQEALSSLKSAAKKSLNLKKPPSVTRRGAPSSPEDFEALFAVGASFLRRRDVDDEDEESESEVEEEEEEELAKSCEAGEAWGGRATAGDEAAEKKRSSGLSSTTCTVTARNQAVFWENLDRRESRIRAWRSFL